MYTFYDTHVYPPPMRLDRVTFSFFFFFSLLLLLLFYMRVYTAHSSPSDNIINPTARAREVSKRKIVLRQYV